MTWFPTYLREAHGSATSEAGKLTSLASSGVLFGGVLGGVISDGLLHWTRNRRLSRQGLAVASMTCCAILIGTAWHVADTETAVLLIGGGALFGTLGGVSTYTIAIELGGKRVASVLSLVNMSGNIGAGLFPLVVGWLVARTGSWDLVLFLFATMFVLDAICWALLNPKGPLFDEGTSNEPHRDSAKSL
jgi:nitrate/nitrite transporter NarK